MGFKENIKKRRLELGLTLEQVAKKISISKPTLQRYESGVISNIPFEKVELLANVLQTSPAYLMGWDNLKSISVSLSDNECKLIEKYRLLPASRKCTVNEFIAFEYEQMKLLDK